MRGGALVRIWHRAETSDLMSQGLAPRLVDASRTARMAHAIRVKAFVNGSGTASAAGDTGLRWVGAWWKGKAWMEPESP